jgi:uncharacterized membrane protein (UPF0136 family)
VPEKTNILKLSARLIGGLAVLFFGAFFIGEGIPDLIKGSDSQLQSIMILMGFAFFGYIFAWFREKEGGYVLLFSGVIIGLTLFYRGNQKDIIMVFVYSIPLIASGLLFVLCSRKDHPTSLNR